MPRLIRVGTSRGGVGSAPIPRGSVPGQSGYGADRADGVGLPYNQLSPPANKGAAYRTAQELAYQYSGKDK